jgi:excisionase family DNA binding protein
MPPFLAKGVIRHQAHNDVGVVAGTIPVNDGETNAFQSDCANGAQNQRSVAASRCGRTTVYEAIKRGELRALKRGKSTLILESDLREWLEALPAVQPKA